MKEWGAWTWRALYDAWMRNWLVAPAQSCSWGAVHGHRLDANWCDSCGALLHDQLLSTNFQTNKTSPIHQQCHSARSHGDECAPSKTSCPWRLQQLWRYAREEVQGHQIVEELERRQAWERGHHVELLCLVKLVSFATEGITSGDVIMN